SRCIYIHGTPEEKTIGRPASYGCIRMKSRDVTALYSQLPVGAVVEIVPDRLPDLPKAPKGTVFTLESPKPEPAPAGETDIPKEKPAETVRKNARPEDQPHFGRSA